jgi:hypothetical protein
MNDDFPIVKSQSRAIVETALITIIALSAWVGFLYFIYLTE